MVDYRPPPGPYCGDDVVDPGEDCDGGQCCTVGCAFAEAATICSDGDACTPTDACDGAGECVPGGNTCGDGALQIACGEQCDDGNEDSLDGCSSSCITETCVAWQ